MLKLISQFLIHFRGQGCVLLFNGILLAQQIPQKLILLRMDYDIALRLENIESQN